MRTQRENATLNLWKRAGLASCAMLALVTNASAQSAAPIVYDIELIVFQNLQAAGTEEDWTLEEQIAARNQSVVAAEEEGAPVVLAADASDPIGPERQVLPRENFRMTALAGSLQRSRSYKPIAHFGWSQMGTPLNATSPVPLGDLLPAGSLTGSAGLALGRYLHLTLDLSYQPPGDAHHYVLRQTRRMRSKERNYIDHPRFGVIALITPQGQQ
jgi:Peptidoglycan-binding protein, CsiV